MADETVGVAKIAIEIDTAKVEPGVNAAKKSVSSLTAEVEQGSAKQVSATKRQTDALERQIAQYGKSRDEIIRWRIETQTSGKVQQDLIAKLDAQVASLKKVDAAMVGNGLSAKQTAAALRGVPAQITDIAVSLQAGQGPLTILLQQGGQLKDMFGGIVPAAKALGSTLLGLVNPYTLVAAGAGAVALAYLQASEESSAYTKALAVSGNAAGNTESKLGSLAAQIAATKDVTVGAAREAVIAAAQNSDITSSNLQAVASAAVAMQELTGQAIDKTVADYAKLAGDPVKAVLAMNDSQNFLTLAVYEHIKALQEEGRYQEAATLATQTASQATVDALAKVRESQTWVAQGWRQAKIEAAGAWETFKGLIGAQSLADERSRLIADNASVKARLDEMNRVGGASDGNYNEIATQLRTNTKRIIEINNELAGDVADAQAKAAQSAAVTVAASLDSIIDAQASKEQKKRREVDKVTVETDAAIQKAKAAGQIKAAEDLEAKKAQAIAAIKKKYADKTKTPSTAGATRSASLQGFRDDQTEDRARIAAETKTLQAAFQAREVSAADYYSRMRELAQEGTDADAATLQKQIAYLQEQSLKGKDAINVNKQISELEAKLAKVRIDGAAAQKALTIQEGAAASARIAAVESYKASLDASTDALQQQMEAMIAKVGTGDREYEIQQKINDAYREGTRRLNDLTLQKNAGQIEPAVFEQERAAVEAATSTRVAIIKAGYQDMAAAQANWANGASAAWANYANEAANVAGQTQSLLTNAFSSAEDVFVEFAKTGKLSFSDLANSIIADLARISAKKAISGLVGSITGGGDTTGSLADLFSGSWGFAKGDVFNSPSLHNYANQVVDKPTMFAFAKGAGLMGEAGPEAIMPLTRTANGKLGVQAIGDGGLNVEINNYGDNKVSARQETGQRPDGTQFRKLILDIVKSDINGGGTGTLMKRRFGLKEAV